MLYYEHPINLMEQFPVRFWISWDLTIFLVETDWETSTEVTIRWVWGNSCFFVRCPLDQSVWSWLRSAIRLECFWSEVQSVNPEKLYAGLSLCGWFSSRCSLSISISLIVHLLRKNVWIIFKNLIYQKNPSGEDSLWKWGLLFCEAVHQAQREGTTILESQRQQTSRMESGSMLKLLGNF